MSGGRRRRELRKGRRIGGDLRPQVPICRGMGVLPLPLLLHAVTTPLLKFTGFEGHTCSNLAFFREWYVYPIPTLHPVRPTHAILMMMGESHRITHTVLENWYPTRGDGDRSVLLPA